jgi:hypothetical protein
VVWCGVVWCGVVWCGVMEWNVLYCFVYYICILSPKQPDSHHQIHVIVLLYHPFTISHSIFLFSYRYISSSHRESHDAQRLASAPVTNNFTLPSRSIAPKYSDSLAPTLITKTPVYPKKKSKWVPKNKTVNDQISR